MADTDTVPDNDMAYSFSVALAARLAPRVIGRAREQSALLQAFEAAEMGKTVFLLIEGPAGIGKSALVEDFRETLPEGTLFADGYYEEQQEHIAYSGLREALTGAARHLLAQDSLTVADWRRRLQDTLGPHGRVVSDLVPEFAQLLNPQEASKELEPAEQRGRLHKALGALLAALAGAGTPIVLFLDNLQWSGQSTYDLLPQLVLPRAGQALLVVGTTRIVASDAEVSLEETLDRISGSGVELHRLTLAPLTPDAVTEMTASRLGDHPDRVRALSAWLHQQALGNPLYIGELLSALIRENALIAPDAAEAAWRWHPGAIVSEDLVALLARHLERLPTATRTALTLGSHLGATFSLDDLACAMGASPTEVAVWLVPAVSDGILMALEATDRPLADGETSLPTGYRFRHDRFAEAALALTPEAERPALHLRIGQALRDAGPPEDSRVREIVAHLNAASALMADPAERVQLAELNLRAGRINRGAAAFADAWRSFRHGLDLLPPEGWRTYYDLTLALHVEAAGVAPLVGQPVAPLAQPVLTHAHTPLDAAEAHRSLILAAAAEGAFAEALRLGNQALAASGEKPLPLNPSRLEVLVSFIRTRALLPRKSTVELRNAPIVNDPHAIAVERILAAMLESFQVQYRALAIATAVLRIVQRTQTDGLSHLSAYGYVAYAAFLIEGLGSLDAAVEYGRLALELAETDGLPWVQSRVQLIWLSTLAHRTRPLSESLEPLQQVARRALSLGDVTTGVIATLLYAQHATTAQCDYAALFEELRKIGEGIGWRGFDALRLDYMMQLQYLQNLRDESPDPTILTGDYWDESAALADLHSRANHAFLASYHVLKAHLAYLHHDYAAALEHADAGRRALDHFASLHAYPASLSVDSLVRLAMAPLVSADRRRNLLRQVAANQHAMAKLVRQMPANYKHFYTLVEAERAWVLGRTAQARVLFETTFEQCQRGGFLSQEAAANESLGCMLMNLGEAAEARRRLSRSRDLYRQIGALAKVSQMARVYARWLDPTPSTAGHVETSLPGGSASTGGQLADADQTRFLQAASEAFAHEPAPGRLLTRLTTTVLEQTEATRAVILARAPDSEHFVFEAECLRDGACDQFESQPFSGNERDAVVPARVLNYTVNTAEPLLIVDAANEQPFAGDSYVRARGTRAVLCLPLRHRGALIGLLYLESSRTPGVFREADIPLLTLVATQAILALENARLLEHREILPVVALNEAAANGEGGPLAELVRLSRAGDWAGAGAFFDAALARAAESRDPILWRALCLDLSPELVACLGGLERLSTVRRAGATLVPPDDVMWRQTLARQAALEAWLRGRLAEVIALGHDAEGNPPEPTEGGIRLFDPLCLAAAAHTARREYDAARACLDLALTNLPIGSLGRDVWIGLAMRRARLFWLLDALPRLEALLREMEVDPSRLVSSLSPALLPTLRGVLALEQENLPVAEQHLTEAVCATAQLPAATLLARPDLHLARVHEAAGRREQAEALIDAALAEVRHLSAPGLIVLEGSAMIPLLRSAAQRGREGPTAARVLGILGVRNVTRRVLIPENGLLLSPREADVLELLATDAGNRLIAERLNVDILTVKSHLTRVLAKLGVSSRHKAAERAKALGLGPDNAV